jgi:hypothetical protein
MAHGRRLEVLRPAALPVACSARPAASSVSNFSACRSTSGTASGVDWTYSMNHSTLHAAPSACAQPRTRVFARDMYAVGLLLAPNGRSVALGAWLQCPSSACRPRQCSCRGRPAANARVVVRARFMCTCKCGPSNCSVCSTCSRAHAECARQRY